MAVEHDVVRFDALGATRNAELNVWINVSVLDLFPVKAAIAPSLEPRL